MKFKKFLLLGALATLSTGCSTMHFNNGQSGGGGAAFSEWHHNAANSLFEVSKPVELKNRCGSKDWASVTTQQSFINGLAGIIDDIVLVDVWDPWTVEYTCRQ